MLTHSLVSSFTGPVSLTIPAHRLMTKAYEIGGPAAQCSLITPIFRAYYEDDLDISDPDVLADAAEQAGIMTKAEVGGTMRGPEIPFISEETRIPCLRVMVTKVKFWFLRH
jgi:hypothetical protein